jgi:hypothetical protein
MISAAANQYGTHRRVAIGGTQIVAQALKHLGRRCVTGIGTVEGDPGDAIADLKKTLVGHFG